MSKESRIFDLEDLHLFSQISGVPWRDGFHAVLGPGGTGPSIRAKRDDLWQIGYENFIIGNSLFVIQNSFFL